MTDLSRRALLGLAAAVPLAGCTGDRPPPPPDPDDLLRAAAVARERALLLQYDAAARGVPSLAVRLAPVRADHEAHLAALLGTPAPSPGPSQPPAPQPADEAHRAGRAGGCRAAGRHSARAGRARGVARAGRSARVALRQRDQPPGGAGMSVPLLTELLEAEHAAVYGYGVLGARLDEDTRRLALTAYDSHRARRDQVAARLRERGGDPEPPPPAYDVAVADPAQALALAVRLEEGLALRWHDLVAGTDERPLRELALAGLRECAVRAAQWRRRAGSAPVTVPLPGT